MTFPCNEKIQSLILTYDQHDTLNIFGQNVYATSGTLIPNHSDPCLSLGPSGPSGPSGPIIINCGCGSNDNHLESTNSVIDYVYTLSQIFPQTGTVYVTLNPTWPYTFHYNTTAEKTLLDALYEYYSLYIQVIASPSSLLIDQFNFEKFNLLRLICEYLQSSLAELFTPGTNITELTCALNGFKCLLCNKKCNESKSCDKNKTCCKQKCENTVVYLIKQIANLFVQTSLLPNPFGFTTVAGVTPNEIHYGSVINLQPIVIGANTYVVPDITNFSVTPGPTPTIDPFLLGTDLSNFYNAYLAYLLCPCQGIAQQNLLFAITTLQTLLNNFTTVGTNDYNALQNLLINPIDLTVSPNTDIRNLGIPPVTLTAYFATLQGLLSQLLFTLNTCSGCGSCGTCGICCEAQIVNELHQLSMDISTQITANATQWWVITSPLPPFTSTTPIITTNLAAVLSAGPYATLDAYLTAQLPNSVSITGPVSTAPTVPSQVTMTFVNVGLWVGCDGTQDEIFLPDITVTTGNGTFCTTTTLLALGDHAQTFYNDYIALATGLCDSGYLARFTAVQNDIIALQPFVCVTGVCNLDQFFEDLGGNIQNDFNNLCALTTNCINPLCCDPAYIASFIIELIDICHANCVDCTYRRIRCDKNKDNRHISNARIEKKKDCGCGNKKRERSISNKSSKSDKSSQSSSFHPKPGCVQNPVFTYEKSHDLSSACRSRSSDSTISSTSSQSTNSINEILCDDAKVNIIDMYLDKTPTKCVDPRVMVLYLYENIIIPMQQQIQCLQVNAQSTKKELCEIKTELCEIKEELCEIKEDLCLSEQCCKEVKEHLCAVERNEFALKSALNNVVKQVKELGCNVVKLDGNVNYIENDIDKIKLCVCGNRRSYGRNKCDSCEALCCPRPKSPKRCRSKSPKRCRSKSPKRCRSRSRSRSRSVSPKPVKPVHVHKEDCGCDKNKSINGNDEESWGLRRYKK